MIRALILAALLAALSGAPVAALDVGDRIGPVIVNPGSVICDTAEDAIGAIRAMQGDQMPFPESCGYLVGQPMAFLYVSEHFEHGDHIFAIIKILFLPPATLGVQYGWASDEGKGAMI